MPRWRAFLAPFASDAEALAWLRRFLGAVSSVTSEHVVVAQR